MLQANVMQSSTETYDDQQATQPESCKISIQNVFDTAFNQNLTNHHS